MNGTVLQRPRVELDKRRRDEQAGFGKKGHVQINYATLRIIVEQSLKWYSPVCTNFMD